MPEPVTRPIDAPNAAVTPLAALDASASATVASSASSAVNAGSPVAALTFIATWLSPPMSAAVSIETAF
jgi:hypothetical protein